MVDENFTMLMRTRDSLQFLLDQRVMKLSKDEQVTLEIMLTEINERAEAVANSQLVIK